MSQTKVETFQMHDRVRITGENGYYWVVGFGQDGSYSLWGGSVDPNGHRQHRAVMPDNLRKDTRKLHKKQAPTFVQHHA